MRTGKITSVKKQGDYIIVVKYVTNRDAAIKTVKEKYPKAKITHATAQGHRDTFCYLVTATKLEE